MTLPLNNNPLVAMDNDFEAVGSQTSSLSESGCRLDESSCPPLAAAPLCFNLSTHRTPTTTVAHTHTPNRDSITISTTRWTGMDGPDELPPPFDLPPLLLDELEDEDDRSSSDEEEDDQASAVDDGATTEVASTDDDTKDDDEDRNEEEEASDGAAAVEEDEKDDVGGSDD